MVLHPVIVTIADNGHHVPPRERLRRQRAAAAIALDESARLTGIPALAWHRDAGGVPVFERGVCWSLSHKPEWSAGVVCDRPIGIDIETIRPRKEGLWDYVSDEAERARVPERDWITFFRFWTAKEAVLKANRVGISRLDDCRIVEGPTSTGAILTFAGIPMEVAFYTSGNLIAAVTGGGQDIEWHVVTDAKVE